MNTTDTYKVRRNGKTLPKPRTLNEVLREAWTALDERLGTYTIVSGPGITGEVTAQTQLSFGRVRFSDGRVLDGVGENFRLYANWR